MPSTSKRQHNLMAMVAHDPAAAKRLGISQKVGKEFMKADVGRKFAEGGQMKESKAMVKKEVSFMKSKGAPKSMIKHEESEMKGMKKGGSVKSSAMGKVVAGGKRAHGEHTVQQKGHTKGKQIVMAGNKGMKKGGKVC
jgi:hypothetical protein